jgi:hypothetical protein
MIRKKNGLVAEPVPLRRPQAWQNTFCRDSTKANWKAGSDAKPEKLHSNGLYVERTTTANLP